MARYQIQTKRGSTYEIETDNEADLDGIVASLESEEADTSRPLPEGVQPANFGAGRGLISQALPTDAPKMSGRRGGTRAESKPFVGGTPAQLPAAPAQKARDAFAAQDPRRVTPAYENRTQALDDAVNLAEETGDLNAVTAAFERAGITRADIVKHGQARGSELFADVAETAFKPTPQQIEQTKTPAQLAAPGDSMAPVEPTAIEEFGINPVMRGVAGARTAANVLGAETGLMSPDSAARGLIASRRQADRYQAGTDIQAQQRAVAAADAEGGLAGAVELFKNPAFALTAIVESVISSAPSIVAGGVGALAGGPVGAATGAAIGSGATEYASSIFDTLQARGVDVTADSLAQALTDPEIMAEARQKAAVRGLAVGAFDGLSAGVAGRFIGAVERAKTATGMTGGALARARLGATGKELGVQAGAGMAGEASAQLATEGKITSGSGVALEGLAEMAGAPGEIAPNLYAAASDRNAGLIGGAITAAPAETNFTPAGAPTRSAGLTDIVLPLPQAPITGDTSVSVSDAPRTVAGVRPDGLGADNLGGLADPGRAPTVDVRGGRNAAGTVAGAAAPADVGAGSGRPGRALTDPIARTSDADLLARIPQEAAQTDALAPPAADRAPAATTALQTAAQAPAAAPDRAAIKTADNALKAASQRADRAAKMLTAAQALGEPDTIALAQEVQAQSAAELAAARQQRATLLQQEIQTNVPTTQELGAQAGQAARPQGQAQEPVAGVPAGAERAASGPAGDLTEGWQAFAPETGTKGIPRAEMPQIQAEHRGAMVNFLGARGISQSAEVVPAAGLKPTQAEFSPTKVAEAAGRATGRSILVSSDDHILDGHHQWLAAAKAGEDVKILRLNAPIEELITTVKDFPSAATAPTTGDTNAAITQSAGPSLAGQPQPPARLAGSTAAQPVGAVPVAAGAVDQPTGTGASPALRGAGAARLDRALRAVESSRARVYGEQSQLKVVDRTTPDEDAAIAFADANGVSVAIVEEAGKSNFNGAAVDGVNILVRGEATDHVLSVAVHEGVHTLPADIKGELIAAVRPTLQNKPAFQKIYRYGAAPDALAKMTPEQRQADDDMVVEEMVSMLAQSEAKRPEFWQKLGDQMGDTSFGKFARHVLKTLDGMMAKFVAKEGLRRDAWTTDLPLVQNALATAYATNLKRRGLSKDADAALAKFVNQDRAVQFSQRVSHGTPHRGIEKFSTEKIGTGKDTDIKAVHYSNRQREHDSEMSTRMPSAVKATEDGMRDLLVADFESAKQDQKWIDATAELVQGYPNYKKSRAATSAGQLEHLIKHMVDNLLWLHDKVPAETRQRSKLWYDGARAITDRWTKRYDLTDAQVAGVLAVLSPQKDWYMNVSLAQRILDTVTDRQNFRWSPQMEETAARIFGKDAYTEDIDAIRGQTLAELDDDYLRGMWVRVYDQAHTPASFFIVSPEGDFVAEARTKTGELGRVAWGGTGTIAKAVSIMLDGSPASISKALGTKHKVRNFYNNILVPGSKNGHVTIDTHAVAAALLRPLSGAAREVMHNFGGGIKGEVGAKSSKTSGLQGSYALYEEAYRRAAEARGILPREMQSITWEAVRGMYAPTFKSQAKNVKAVDAVWNLYKIGKISHAEAQKQVLALSGGITPPTWSGPNPGAYEEDVEADDAGDVSADGVPGPGAGSADSGADQPPAGAVQGGRGEPKFSNAADRAGRREGRELAPLAGAPAIVGATGPDPRVVAVAESYARSIGIDLKRQAEYVKVDPARAARIADAYQAMRHEPGAPRVKEAFANLIRQTRAQYDALVNAGYEFTFFDGASDPYQGNPWNAMRDLRANQKMAVYGTYDGYGTEGVTTGAVDDNPMLAETGLSWPDQSGAMHPVLANDLFRAVHDAFGHGLEGAGFRAEGEENAWQAHVRLFTGSAVAAITTETRGQNSFLNYGPHGEKNRTAAVEDTVFADQKTGLMPSWTWTEGLAGDEPAFSNAPTRDATADDFRPENLAGLLSTDRWSVLTAEDPSATKATPAQNAAAMQRLKIDLREAGAKFIPVVGKYGDVQNSLIVTNIDEAKAIELGAKYGQESILTRRGLVYMDGRPDTRAVGIETFDSAPADFYTEIPSTGAFFSVDLDWGVQASNTARPQFFSALSRMIDSAPAKMASMPATQWQVWIKANASKAGVKADEIAWSGIDDYLKMRGKSKVSIDEVASFLAGSGVKVEETVLGGVDSGETKFAGYVVPGGENYREVLVTMPNEPLTISRYARARGITEAEAIADRSGFKAERDRQARQSYQSQHWDQPNVLVHMRVDDRMDADGNGVLFLHDLQSDWSADNRKAREAVGKKVDRDFTGIVARMKAAGVLEVECD